MGAGMALKNLDESSLHQILFFKKRHGQKRKYMQMQSIKQSFTSIIQK